MQLSWVCLSIPYTNMGYYSHGDSLIMYEIERRFLVKKDLLPSFVEWTLIIQGYICNDIKRVVRIRLATTETESKATVTIKGEKVNSKGFEFEYSIPPRDVVSMITNKLTTSVLFKTRYIVEYEGHTWEIDQFEEANKGLIIAEIELSHTDEKFEKPEWLGDEITDDHKYSNLALSNKPYAEWEDCEKES